MGRAKVARFSVQTAAPPRVELGHGLRRGLAVAAGLLAPLAACDDQSRLFRVEAEIAGVAWFNQPASGQNDCCGNGDDRLLLAVPHYVDPLHIPAQRHFPPLRRHA
jgi:hypothetical protein